MTESRTAGDGSLRTVVCNHWTRSHIRLSRTSTQCEGALFRTANNQEDKAKQAKHPFACLGGSWTELFAAGPVWLCPSCTRCCFAAALVTFCLLLSGCTYVRFMFEHWETRREQFAQPSLARARTIDPENCLVVYGQVTGATEGRPLAVVALTDSFGKTEVADAFWLQRPGYYALYLPPGRYRVAALADLDGDTLFEGRECAGRYRDGAEIVIGTAVTGPRVVSGIDIAVSGSGTDSIDLPAPLSFAHAEELRQSAYYPPGSLRSLDDEIFSAKYGLLGYYDPPAFLARAGIYFYAIEERDMRKVPIVFVHGAGGTPAEFRYMVEHIDRERFDPWFFYYPSGERLDKMADVFAEIFFSGRIINLRRRTLLIVAHSMGGLVVREAINRYNLDGHDRFLKLLITLCTPYGGNTDAVSGVESAPLVVPSWRDVAEGSEFLSGLWRRPLPSHVDFRLFFAYRNDGWRSGENSDGTIALRSQLEPRAQSAAREVRGFNETHIGILQSPAVMERLNAILTEY